MAATAASVMVRGLVSPQASFCALAVMVGMSSSRTFLPYFLLQSNEAFRNAHIFGQDVDGGNGLAGGLVSAQALGEPTQQLSDAAKAATAGNTVVFAHMGQQDGIALARGRS